MMSVQKMLHKWISLFSKVINDSVIPQYYMWSINNPIEWFRSLKKSSPHIRTINRTGHLNCLTKKMRSHLEGTQSESEEHVISKLPTTLEPRVSSVVGSTPYLLVFCRFIWITAEPVHDTIFNFVSDITLLSPEQEFKNHQARMREALSEHAKAQLRM